MQKFIVLLNEGPVCNEGTTAEYQKPSGDLSGKKCLVLLQNLLQVDPAVQLEFTETDAWEFKGWVKNKSFNASKSLSWINSKHKYFTYPDSLPCLIIKLSSDDESVEETMSSVIDTLIDQEIIFAIAQPQ